MAEWLRFWTANLLRSPCFSSSHISIDTIFGSTRHKKNTCSTFKYHREKSRTKKVEALKGTGRSDKIQVMYSIKNKFILLHEYDKVAEWSTRWNTNPKQSPCVGSNPITVDIYFGHKNRNLSQFDNTRSSHIDALRKGLDVLIRRLSASDSTSLKFVVQWLLAGRPRGF